MVWVALLAAWLACLPPLACQDDLPLARPAALAPHEHRHHHTRYYQPSRLEQIAEHFRLDRMQQQAHHQQQQHRLQQQHPAAPSTIELEAASEAATQARAAGKINFYYDASNMPTWLTPPWITSAFRTGPLALPRPDQGEESAGPMFMGVPPQPILPFDSMLPADAQPISEQMANYPSQMIPSGNQLNAGQSPPLVDGNSARGPNNPGEAESPSAQKAAAGSSFLEIEEQIHSLKPNSHSQSDDWEGDSEHSAPETKEDFSGHPYPHPSTLSDHPSFLQLAEHLRARHLAFAQHYDRYVAPYLPPFPYGHLHDYEYAFNYGVDAQPYLLPARINPYLTQDMPPVNPFADARPPPPTANSRQ